MASFGVNVGPFVTYFRAVRQVQAHMRNARREGRAFKKSMCIVLRLACATHFKIVFAQFAVEG